MKFFGTALFSIFVFSAFIFPVAAEAQVCVPACGPGTYCIYGSKVNSSGQVEDSGTMCNKDGDNGVVVTGQRKGSITFKQWVEGIIIPFVNNYVVKLLYILAFLFFIFGVFKYFFTGGQENRETAHIYIMWSLIGMVVIFGVWGIVRLLLNIIPIT
ncbi:MAG: hypothetical protein JWL82_364 [Parcubacteria group bacterium]|nr:hypothetical protein [Parcubacteria group bacterium]